VGYAAYSRDHSGSCPPATAALDLSGDAAFGGSPARLNPEQLLVAAAASCQLLSFLAVAARARIDVVEYTDDAIGVMPEDWITSITLRPLITLTSGPSEERVRRLVDVAHRECYIANSLRSEVTVEPTIVFRPRSSG